MKRRLNATSPPPADRGARSPRRFCPTTTSLFSVDVGQARRKYRRLSTIGESTAIEDVRLEIRDRFGPLPPAAEGFFHVAQLRVLGASLGIEGIMVRGRRGPQLPFATMRCRA